MEAVDHIRRAIRRDKTSSRAHAILAGYLEDEKNPEEARKEWNLAKEWAMTPSQRTQAEERLRALGSAQ